MEVGEAYADGSSAKKEGTAVSLLNMGQRSVLQHDALVICEEAAAADGSSIKVEKQEMLSGGEGSSQNVKSEDHLLVSSSDASFCPEREKPVLGEAVPVSLGVVKDLARDASMEIVRQVLQYG